MLSGIAFFHQFTKVQILILILSASHTANGAKILFFVGYASHSHRVAIQPLAAKLAEIGHEVTFFTPLEPEVKNPNITEFCPKALLDFNNNFNDEYSNKPVISRLKHKGYDEFLENFGTTIWDLAHISNEITIKNNDFKEWLKKSTFDLVITEHPRFEIALGIAYKYGAKVIGFSPAPLWAAESDNFGIPPESSWFSSWTIGQPFSFIPDRFHREYNAIGWHLIHKWIYFPKTNALLQEVFDKNIPPVQGLVKNISLVFVNTHFSSEYAKSLPPFVIPVGGMHVQDPKLRKPLPKTIEDFIGGSKSEGFIYISFGSILKISALPQETRKSIFDSIAKYPNARFLIKWNDDIPKNLPTNVLPMKWFPQQDLLAHPKCRGFISQGGLMSFQQATYNGVPVVISPVFGDQPYNARAAAHHGSGIYLELADITFDTFSDALGQLLYNETLSANAKEVGRRFRDRPMSALDTAVWWTEYVLRHNDTMHLKPLGINQEWWQRRQLDFWGLIFISVSVCIALVVMTIRSLFRLLGSLRNRSADKVKTH